MHFLMGGDATRAAASTGGRVSVSVQTGGGHNALIELHAVSSNGSVSQSTAVIVASE